MHMVYIMGHIHQWLNEPKNWKIPYIWDRRKYLPLSGLLRLEVYNKNHNFRMVSYLISWEIFPRSSQDYIINHC